MRILHIMLANFYCEGYEYQENILPQMNKKDGHDVKIIASTEAFDETGKYTYLKPQKYANKYDIEVVRLPYVRWMPSIIARKVRIYKGLWEQLELYKPDLIFCHSLMFWDLRTISAYKKKYPQVKLYADFHSDYNNSATNFISKNILHKMIYRPIILKHMKNFEKLYYITVETKEFLQKLYKIPDEYLEFYPLGGIIECEKVRDEYRNKIRNKLGIKKNEMMILHSGKMGVAKKTVNILSALKELEFPEIKLVLIGVFDEKYEKDVMAYIESDNRMIYEGWKSGEELRQYMCAADLYLQPGSQSIVAQTAVCSNCGLAVAPHISYKELFGERVFYVESKEEIKNLIEEVINNPQILEEKRKQGFDFAQSYLDYRVLSRKYMTV